MKEFKNSNQMKAFMKKESERLNISISNVYHTFVARKLLEKVSKSQNDLILVKGSSAETAYLGSLVRGITDVDLAGLNGLDVNKDFLVDILLNNEDEQIKFSLKKKPTITNTGIHKFSTEACFDVMRQDLNVDFQTDYDRLIEPQIRVMPKIFDGDEEFEIKVPSFEEYLAEKLCIIVESNKEDVLNTRVKDFYDIYQLHGGTYDYDKLTYYFGEMLKLRGKIDINEASTIHLNQKFIKSHKPIWETNKEKYDFLDKEIDLEGAVYYTRGVLREQLQKHGLKLPKNNNIKSQKIKRLSK